MSMSKKDYVLIADALSEAIKRDGLMIEETSDLMNTAVDALATAFARDNPAFKTSLFEKAVWSEWQEQFLPVRGESHPNL